LLSHHENIVNVLEIVVGDSIDDIFIVMEFVEHDLKSLMESKKNTFTIPEIKTILLQLVSFSFLFLFLFFFLSFF